MSKSEIPEAFLQEQTEEQQQEVRTWLEANPSCSCQDLVAFVNSVNSV